MRVRFRMLALVAGLMLFSSAAGAQDRPFAVSYEAYADCPPESAFVREIKLRTRRARLAVAAETAHRFDVTLERTSAGTTGRLRIRETDGAEAVREVDSETCGEVVSALALIAALTLDPEASTEPLPQEALASENETLAARARPPSELTERETRRATLEPPAADRTSRAPLTSSRRRSWGSSVGGQAGINNAVPVDLMTFALFTELDRPSRGWAARGTLSYAPSAEIEGDRGAAQFQWLAARLDGCFVVEPLSRLRFDPCLGFEAGWISGHGLRGGEIVRPLSDAAPWLALLGTTRLRAEIQGPIFAEISGSILLPLHRARFVFDVPEDPESKVYEVPPIGLSAALGAGLRFL